MSSVIPKFAFRAEDIIKSGRVNRSDVEEIKKWLGYRRDIPELADEQIVLFLVSCYNIIEDTQTTIKAYFHHRYNAPEIFCDRNFDCEDLQKICKTVEFICIPTKTKNNHAIIMSRFRDTYYGNFTMDPSLKATFMLLEAHLHDWCPDGLIVLYDMKGLGVMHLTRAKLSSLKKFFAYLQEGLPAKLKEIHIFNVNYLFEKVLLILKPFMKKELFNMLRPHPPTMSMEEFFEKELPAECIPSNYGGKLPDTEELCKSTMEKFQRLRDFFDATEKQTMLYSPLE